MLAEVGNENNSIKLISFWPRQRKLPERNGYKVFLTFFKHFLASRPKISIKYLFIALPFLSLEPFAVFPGNIMFWFAEIFVLTTRNIFRISLLVLPNTCSNLCQRFMAFSGEDPSMPFRLTLIKWNSIFMTFKLHSSYKSIWNPILCQDFITPRIMLR